MRQSASGPHLKKYFAAIFFLGSVVGGGCSPEQQDAEPQVEIGVFFGGQVQRLKRVEVSRVTPPILGFRVHVPESFAEEKDRTIRYEVVAVGPAGRRVTRHGEFDVKVGQLQIDQVIDVPDSARLGVWNVRVEHGKTILADRALFLVPASQ